VPRNGVSWTSSWTVTLGRTNERGDQGPIGSAADIKVRTTCRSAVADGQASAKNKPGHLGESEILVAKQFAEAASCMIASNCLNLRGMNMLYETMRSGCPR